MSYFTPNAIRTIDRTKIGEFLISTVGVPNALVGEFSHYVYETCVFAANGDSHDMRWYRCSKQAQHAHYMICQQIKDGATLWTLDYRDETLKQWIDGATISANQIMTAANKVCWHDDLEFTIRGIAGPDDPQFESGDPIKKRLRCHDLRTTVMRWEGLGRSFKSIAVATMR